MNDNDFTRRREEAVEQMRQMNSRAVPSGQSMPPVPPFVKAQGKRQSRQNSSEPIKPDSEQKATVPQKPPQNSGNSGGLDLPFLDMLTKEGDVSLIIGLLLILLSEKADKKLLFALVYILGR